jgi:conjugative transfer signal peptidase TraF
MPEPRDTGLVHWGEALRRGRRERRRARLAVGAAAAAGIAATAALGTLLSPPEPIFVWNVSASSPVGLYRVTGVAPLRPGDTLVAWAPAEARHLAAERGYVPASVPLVKRVAAVSADRVCAAGDSVFVNGRIVALRRERDGLGRPLPWWRGCVGLTGGDVFLISPAADSFDGRYFGITRPGELVGRARLLWPR